MTESRSLGDRRAVLFELYTQYMMGNGRHRLMSSLSFVPFCGSSSSASFVDERVVTAGSAPNLSVLSAFASAIRFESAS